MTDVNATVVYRQMDPKTFRSVLEVEQERQYTPTELTAATKLTFALFIGLTRVASVIGDVFVSYQVSFATRMIFVLI